MSGAIKTIAAILAGASMMIHSHGQTVQSYDIHAQVSKVENSTVQVVDSAGYVWEVYAAGFNQGDDVVITIDTNRTDSITDNQVIDIR